MSIGEKVAYLKGLAEGLEISSDSKNGKIIKGILDILEDMADSIAVLEDGNETLEDYITEIDEDLGMLEEECEKTCGHKLYKQSEKNAGDSGKSDGEEKESADSELLDGVFEMRCPHCKEHIWIETDDILNSDDMSIECPECGEDIEIMRESSGCSCSRCGINDYDDYEEDEDEDDDEKENNEDNDELAF